MVTRRWVIRTAVGGLVAARYLRPARPLSAQATALPPPVDPQWSLEVCLNSRTSHHGSLGGRATDQQLANVLWAAGRAPVTGSRRTIYVATPEGKYVYHPEDHTLTPHADEPVGNAFRITYDRERDFDAGVSYTFGLLAAVAQWSGTSGQLASCPVGSDLNFGIGTVTGLSTEAVAASSDSSLPTPVTDGATSLHRLIGAARLARDLAGGPSLTTGELGQLLWAAYGCTPHRASNGRGGLTVPSWRAEYFLTGRVYAIGDRVWRYVMRRGSDQTTRDHRLEVVQDADVRGVVPESVPAVPAAPCHLVLCLPRASAQEWYAVLEAGFAAGGILLQATALGLGCHFAAALAPAEQAALQELAHIPADDLPHAVVSVGRAAEGGVFLPWASRG
jgi:nitroreductase